MSPPDDPQPPRRCTPPVGSARLPPPSPITDAAQHKLVRDLQAQRDQLQTELAAARLSYESAEQDVRRLQAEAEGHAQALITERNRRLRAEKDAETARAETQQVREASAVSLLAEARALVERLRGMAAVPPGSPIARTLSWAPGAYERRAFLAFVRAACDKAEGREITFVPLQEWSTAPGMVRTIGSTWGPIDPTHVTPQLVADWARRVRTSHGVSFTMCSIRWTVEARAKDPDGRSTVVESYLWTDEL